MGFLLPPASEGWRKVMFSLCPPFRGGGDYPISSLDGPDGGGVPYPRSGWGGGGGMPSFWLGGVPHSRSGLGGTPIQDQDGGYPWLPTPNSGLDGVTPPPSKTEWGTPPPHPGLDGVPPPQIRRQISKASTCYAAGGVFFRSRRRTFLFLDTYVLSIVIGWHFVNRWIRVRCTNDPCANWCTLLVLLVIQAPPSPASVMSVLLPII